LDAFLNQSITQNEHDKKARELKERREEINQLLRNHEHADEDFTISVKLLLELVNHAGRLFRSSDVEEKRKLISLVYQNLTLHNGKAQFTLRKPFELFLEPAKTRNWRPQDFLRLLGRNHIHQWPYPILT